MEQAHSYGLLGLSARACLQLANACSCQAGQREAPPGSIHQPSCPLSWYFSTSAPGLGNLLLDLTGRALEDVVRDVQVLGPPGSLSPLGRRGCDLPAARG